jgi:hypothetical protein
MEVKCHEVRLFHYLESGFDSYVIEIPSVSLTEWCLHSCLLLLGALNSLLVGPSADGFSLSIHLYSEKAKDVMRGIYKYDGRIVHLYLPQEQVKLWMWLPLQHLYTNYIKEERGYTDHIDMEFDSDVMSGDTLNLTMIIV